jgi:hypothetical protein
MTLVAAGWPTTFWDKTAVRFSTGSATGFLTRVPEVEALRSTILLTLLYSRYPGNRAIALKQHGTGAFSEDEFSVTVE